MFINQLVRRFKRHLRKDKHWQCRHTYIQIYTEPKYKISVGLYSSVVERQSCKLKVRSSILRVGTFFLQGFKLSFLCFLNKIETYLSENHTQLISIQIDFLDSLIKTKYLLILSFDHLAHTFRRLLPIVVHHSIGFPIVVHHSIGFQFFFFCQLSFLQETIYQNDL